MTIHEFAHGWVAHKCGDDTALHAGRLTLNPLAHLDLFGTLCFLIAGFGWAKPVPVNPYNFRNPRRDDILVSLAGVCANLLSALAFALILRAVVTSYGYERLLIEALNGRITFTHTLVALLETCVFINLILIFFNLIPVPPLDGSHVLEQFLPWDLRERYNREIRPYGMFILMGLIFILPMLGFNVLRYIIWVPTRFIEDALQGERIGLLISVILRGLH